jgi:hypothetical protein
VEAKAEMAKRKERIEAMGREEEAAKAKEAADLAEAARRDGLRGEPHRVLTLRLCG